jgi:hypothetical protein
MSSKVVSLEDKTSEIYFVLEKYRLCEDYQINPWSAWGLSLEAARELIEKEQAYDPRNVPQRDWRIIKQTTIITHEIVENIPKRDSTIYD